MFLSLVKGSNATPFEARSGDLLTCHQLTNQMIGRKIFGEMEGISERRMCNRFFLDSGVLAIFRLMNIQMSLKYWLFPCGTLNPFLSWRNILYKLLFCISRNVCHFLYDFLFPSVNRSLSLENFFTATFQCLCLFPSQQQKTHKGSKYLSSYNLSRCHEPRRFGFTTRNTLNLISHILRSEIPSISPKILRLII